MLTTESSKIRSSLLRDLDQHSQPNSPFSPSAGWPVAWNHWNRSETALIIRKMKIKLTIRSIILHINHISIFKTRNQIWFHTYQTGKNFKNLITPSVAEPQAIAYTRVEYPGTTTLANSCHRLVKLTMHIFCDPAIPLPGLYIRETLAYVHGCKKVHQSRKHNSMWYILTKQCDVAVK